MKKVFFFVFAACCMTAMAQHVVPVNIEVEDLKLDSLRALYQAEPMMYRASLDVLSQQLANNTEELKKAKTQLKAEQNHGKQMQASLKEATGVPCVACSEAFRSNDLPNRLMITCVNPEQSMPMAFLPPHR